MIEWAGRQFSDQIELDTAAALDAIVEAGQDCAPSRAGDRIVSGGDTGKGNGAARSEIVGHCGQTDIGAGIEKIGSSFAKAGTGPIVVSKVSSEIDGTVEPLLDL